MGKSGKNNRKKNLGKEPIVKLPGAAGPAAGKKLEKPPSKMFDMTEEGFKMVQAHARKQMERIGFQKELSELRYLYIKRERDLIAQWDAATNNLESLIKSIKSHHGIIGEIEGFDVDQRKIILK